MRKRHASQYANFGSLHKFTYDGLNCMLDAVYGEEIYIYEFERTRLNVSGVISR